jgi:pyruvate kinase
MSASAHRPLTTGPFGETVLQFAALRDRVRRATDCADVQLCDLAAGRERSLRNLHAYLALRTTDLSPMQLALGRLGLASLDHAEAHVLASLDAVLANLCLLHGQAPDAPELLQTIGEFDEGPARLERNTDLLFGARRPGRRARIMVTLPDDAADNPSLLQSLLQEGMDCARINCAYGDQANWSRVLETLREAEAATGRACRVFMDLRGPKLRTGPMELQPPVLKIRPVRAADGRVLRPARIWLTGTAQPPPGPADASLTLESGWLGKLRNGDRLRLRDARGSGRKWRIAERNPEGCWAESRKTTYLANGTVLHLQRGDDQPDLSTTLASLPPQESRMTIRTGDTVRLTYGAEPGKPAVHDLAGRLLRPGTVPVDVAEVFRDARAGEPIRFDDGRIVGVIEEADGNTLQVRVLHTRRPVERMSSGKGINLPATRLALPALSDEDLRDLEFVARNADIIGLSFTNDAADVRFLNERLRHLGNQEVGVIFKIETDRGCANLPGILIEAMKFPNFGVMVARGDLAAECGFERLAELQDDILRLCESAHVPVVWATGVLESLARSGHPARAEITDAAAAQRAECVMLGKGRYIADAVRTLDGLLGRMLTRDYKHQRLLGRLRFTPGGGGGRSPANPSTRCPPTST